MSATPDDIPALEIKCELCDGEGGKRQIGGQWISCYECEGFGVKTTEFGKRLLRFVADHIDASSRVAVRL